MSDHEQDFEALRRLLALKRHEVPPPGYFEDFSCDVIARVRAREAAARMPWFLKLLQAFESRPAYPVALASSLCLLLLFGIARVGEDPAISPVFAANVSGFPVATITMGLQTGNSQSLPAMATNPPVDLSANPALFSSRPNP
jgi:hypothetical protein